MRIIHVDKDKSIKEELVYLYLQNVLECLR